MREISDTMSLLEVLQINAQFHPYAQADFAGALGDGIAMLNELNVPYILIGSNALHVYGYTRATKDIDFAIDYSDLSKVMIEPEYFGFRRVENDGAQLRHRSGVLVEFVVFHPEFYDIGLDENETEIVDLHGKPVVVPSLGLLFGYKLNSKRAKDWADVLELIKARPNADYDRIRMALLKHPDGETLVQKLDRAFEEAQTEQSLTPSMPTETRASRQARRTKGTP